jgi:hypothetical protein
LKIPITKRAGGVAQGEGPEFKAQYHKKKKKKRKKKKRVRSMAVLTGCSETCRDIPG